MKVRFVQETNLPGAFVVEAETTEEAFILRNFVNWPATTGQSHQLVIANHGGNVSEGRQSFMFQWRRNGEGK
jgi:hypothetical protein